MQWALFALCTLIKNGAGPRFLFRFVFWYDGNCFPIAQTTFEFHNARNFREQCVVLAHANVQAGVHRCATLANDDVARNDTAAAGFFNTQTTSRGIASVGGCRTCFLVCHN